LQTEAFGVTVCDRTIRVHGELDLATAEQLLEAISCLAKSIDNRTVVVDMGWATFVDSEGLAALVGAHKALAAMGKELVLHNVPNTAHRVMAIGGLAAVLNIRSTAMT